MEILSHKIAEYIKKWALGYVVFHREIKGPEQYNLKLIACQW